MTTEKYQYQCMPQINIQKSLGDIKSDSRFDKDWNRFSDSKWMSGCYRLDF